MSEQEQIFKELQVAFTKMVNEQSDLVIHRDNLKKENKELRKLVQQWELENKVLQESLDGAQREIERLNYFPKVVYQLGTDSKEYIELKELLEMSKREIERLYVVIRELEGDI